MNLIASPAPGLAQLPPLPIYRFSVDQYPRLIAAGILGDEDPVELLEGLIVLKGSSTLAPAITVLPDPTGNGNSCPPLPIRRFTVDEYHRMVRAGILAEDDPVELLEGWLVLKMPRNPPHDSALYRTAKRISERLPAEWLCRSQLALTADVSEPEPDVAVVRGPEERYDREHPRPRDTALVVEVADTTLLRDRTLKAALYARVGIPVYWIVNIADAWVEVYTDPTGPDPSPQYRQRRDYGRDEMLPLVLDGQEVGQLAAGGCLPAP
jgi:Uma2 family endonuclease